MLESDEAARRLGVKVTTLYAYVSRGLLVSHPAPEGRRRLFAVDDVERLARRSRQGKTVETRMATVTTAVTQLTDDGPVYRGVRAVDLATTEPFEDVADWLWRGSARSDGPDVTGDFEPWMPLDLGPPPTMSPSDRMRWVVVMAGARDRLRSDLRPEAVTATARRVAASMVEALPWPDLLLVVTSRGAPVPRRRPGATRRPGRSAGGQVEPGAESRPWSVRSTPPWC